jgi:superfamily I DNA/RNA helicase
VLPIIVALGYDYRNPFEVQPEYAADFRDEMRERVERLLGRSAQGTWISTFHSACVRILRRHIDRLGFQKNFVIYDEQIRAPSQPVMKERIFDFKTYIPERSRRRSSI